MTEENWVLSPLFVFVLPNCYAQITSVFILKMQGEIIPEDAAIGVERDLIPWGDKMGSLSEY